jgi:hypothetical protein
MKLERLTEHERLFPGRLIFGLKPEDLCDALRQEGILAPDAKPPITLEWNSYYRGYHLTIWPEERT